jgi:ferredoxin--NADP+ reductase
MAIAVSRLSGRPRRPALLRRRTNPRRRARPARPGLARMRQWRVPQPATGMSSAFITETILDVRHWTDAYFSFTCTRDDGFRFENGQFVMIGLMVDGKPLMRAYSIASPNWEEQLEFFSIKVPDGPLTSRLQHIRPGDSLLLSRKPTGTLLISDVHPGGNLYLLATGTGLAPFLSVIRDPATYERFDRVIVTHGVREQADLAYRDYIERELPHHEYLGEQIREKLLYYPAVSREPFRHQGRLTDLMASGAMQRTLGLPELNPETDRAMICGSPQMLADFRRLLDARGLVASPKIGQAGHYVFERAFVEK